MKLFERNKGVSNLEKQRTPVHSYLNVLVFNFLEGFYIVSLLN